MNVEIWESLTSQCQYFRGTNSMQPSIIQYDPDYGYYQIWIHLCGIWWWISHLIYTSFINLKECMIENNQKKGNAYKRWNYLLKSNNDKDVHTRRMLMLIYCNSKLMPNFLDDSFRSGIKTFQAKFLWLQREVWVHKCFSLSEDIGKIKCIKKISWMVSFSWINYFIQLTQ